MSYAAATIKLLLFLFNLLFVITGIILISVGVTVKEYYISYEDLLDSAYFSTPNLLIAIGVIIFIIAFFGCCGAIKQNDCMLMTFVALLVLIFILEFAAGISGYVLKSDTTEFLSEVMRESMTRYKANSTNESTKMWDILQRDFTCCGVINGSDWTELKQFNNTIPISCCTPPLGVLGTFTCTINGDGYHKEGCIDNFGLFVRTHAVTIGSIGLSFAAIQVLAIFFACHLAKQAKKSYSPYV